MQVNRRQFLQTAAAAAATTPFVGCGRKRAAERRLRPVRRPAMGLHGRRRTSVPEDAQHRSHCERRASGSRTRSARSSLCSPSRASFLSGLYAHRHQVINNFTEFPTQHPELSAAPARRRIQHGVHRQVAHGRGQRREAPGVRLLGQPQGPGPVLRHAVQHRRPATGHQGLLLARRHEPGDRLAEDGAAAVLAHGRSQGAARPLDS